MAWAPDYITGPQLKAYMKITHDHDDDEIALAASGASRAVDYHCNRQFGILAAPAERTYDAWYDSERGLWVVDTDDFFGTLDAVTIDGVVTTDYTREPLNAASEDMPYTRITIDRAASVVPVTPLYRVAATKAWGWLTTPNAVLLASRLQGSRFHWRQQSPQGVTGSPDQGGELRLLARVDPDVGVSLRRFVRPRRPR